MISKLTRMMMTLGFCLIPVAVFAQDGGSGGIDLDLKQIIATLIVGAGIPLAVQILKQVWPSAPGLLKTIAPLLVGPLLGMAASALSAWLGVPVDFGPIINIIVGGAALGAISSGTFKFAKKDPQLLGTK